MLKIEKFVTMSPEQWQIVIEGTRNPMNSWGKMDSGETWGDIYELGPNDHKLLMNLAKGGPVEAKYRRMMPVWVTVIAPLYWWKEYDTYKVGTVANSCSTMHKIQEKAFTLEDFSYDHLMHEGLVHLSHTIDFLNHARRTYLNGGERCDKYGNWTHFEPKSKDVWWDMIQSLPTNYNQKRTLFLNYEVLHNIYHSRKNHKLDEWHVFCDWIRELPYSELIIGDTDGE